MLQLLRNKAQSVIIQAIVVIIALVFIFWGVGTNMSNNRESAIVINDDEISFEEFQKAYERTIDNFKEQFGGNIPQNLIDGPIIKQQVVNQLIQNSLLRQGAVRMGLKISPAEIQDTIENMVQFQENGMFNLEKYNSLLTANRYSPHKFEDTMRYDMLAQRAALDIKNFATTTSDYEINDLYNLENTLVSVNFVKVSPEDFQDTITPTEDELNQWYASVQDNYKTAPLLRLKYLSFTFKDISSKVTIDEDTVEENYKKNLSRYTNQEQRRARHILLKTEENASNSVHADQLQKAKKVLKLAKAGEDFAKLAEKFSEGPTKTNGGDLGLFTQGRMVQPFDDTVFKMQEGEISDIVKTSFGYHIIKLEEIQPIATTPLAEVHEAIVKELQTVQAKPIAFQLANEAYEGIISAGSLSAYITKNPDALLKQTDFFNRNSPPPEIKGDLKFLDKAFSLKEGELSSLIETSTGYAILFADKITPPATPPIEDINERVAKDYKAEKALEIAQNNAADLLSKSKENGDLKNAAAESGMTVENSGLLAKNNAGDNSTFPASLKEQVYQLSAKSPFPEEPGAVEGNFYVFQFAERKEPETALSENERNLYKETLLQFKQQQLLSSWLEQQEKNAEIFTHKSL